MLKIYSNADNADVMNAVTDCVYKHFDHHPARIVIDAVADWRERYEQSESIDALKTELEIKQKEIDSLETERDDLHREVEALGGDV